MPWVFSQQFRVSFMPSAPGFGTWHSSRAQSRHGSYTLSLKRLKDFTLTEQTSGQMTATNSHSINKSNNKHISLYPVMDTLFIFIAVSHWSYVRLPKQTMHTSCQQEFSEDIVDHFLNHSVYCTCFHLAWYAGNISCASKSLQNFTFIYKQQTNTDIFFSKNKLGKTIDCPFL